MRYSRLIKELSSSKSLTRSPNMEASFLLGRAGSIEHVVNPSVAKPGEEKRTKLWAGVDFTSLAERRKRFFPNSLVTNSGGEQLCARREPMQSECFSSSEHSLLMKPCVEEVLWSNAFVLCDTPINFFQFRLERI